MTSLKTECRKFSPNIFNKSKCQNCFRGKDAHSSEALESNRATRKVTCCGYLFVAPGWDFSLPANRNKRWQRRWFVLYDDGELAYSVDEHPETVPQAVIDMNCVLEVADAESVTGNPYALAVTCPDKVHFIKGMNKEESKKWFEVLSKFPRNTVCGKYKRNATFPCIKATSVPKIETENSSVTNNRRETVELSNYAKHNGYVNSLNRNNRNQNSSIPFDPDDDVFPTKDTNSSKSKTIQPETNLVLSENKKENSSDIVNENNLRNSVQDNNNSKSEDIKKYLKRDGRDIRKHHSRSDVSKMIPSSLEDKSSSKTDWKKVTLDLDSVDCVSRSYPNPVYLLMSDVPSGKKIDSYENFFAQDKPTYLRRQASFGKRSDLHKQMLWDDNREAELKNRTLHKSASVPNAVLQDENKILINGNNKSVEKYSTDSLEKMKSNINQIRGDPDGCNLDSLPSYYASTAEYGDQNTENVFLKKGWLVKQDECKWNKYWFVLRNSALTYYSDPIAEDAGILDGVVDLRKVKSVSEVQSSSGHTFCVLMKDFSKLYLSAVTSKIRNNWIRAILQAANLKVISSEDSSPKKQSELDLKELPQDKPPCIVYPDTSISSLESEKSSCSSGSKTLVEEEDSERIQDHKSVALPPSPPLARTAISRVKERARTRSNSRTRSSRFRASEIHESDHNYLADSDDGTTDQSSSSLHNSAVTVVKERKSSKESSPKHSEEKCRPERRRSFRLSHLDNLSFQEIRKRVTEIKDKLEDASWSIWLDISKFCKEVESKLDELEEKSPKNGPQLTGEQKKEIVTLVSVLGRVEDRLHKVQSELEKAKTSLFLDSKDNDLEFTLNKSIGCHSLKQEVSRLNGMSSQNALLAQQLYKVREENRRLKSEIKNAQTSADDFELKCISFKQASEQADKLHKSQMELMIARVDDLTSKLLASEKVVRQLKQRVMKLEQRQERRRSSLKGKEALSLSKEYETKLSELEQKIDAVEGVLKSSESTSESVKDKDNSKESQSLLMRLHNLDKKVKDVTETVSVPSEDSIVKHEDLPKPKIRLQVNLNDNTPLQDTSEDWNSLSLSASMTDLSNPDKDEVCDDDSMSLSYQDCLESLGHKVSSLVTWLKTSLQLLYAQGHMNPFHSSKINFISSEASEELGRLVKVLDYVTGKFDESPLASQNVTYIVGRLLYNIILLQEVTNIIFKMSDFEKYKTAILVQHLNRVKQAILGIEQYIQQKSSPVHTNVQKLSLCNIVACLLFYRNSMEDVGEVTDIKMLFEEVDSQRQKVCKVLSEFKEKFIERFCTTILELSEDSVCDKNSPKVTDQKNDTRPLGQKQFLSHISHIISQVSQSFIAHISKSLNEVYFLCSSFQYSEKWADYICKLLQQELSLLSSEIKSICLKHLESNFFSSSKCGVLVEYMHCSISELAQIVSIITVVDGTVILIKDAIYGDNERLKSLMQVNLPCSSDKDAFNTFHESLQVRTMSIMANLPLYRFPNAFFSLCNPNELNVAHRSVSSLLCFKQKWKSVTETERKEYILQLDKLKARIAELVEEQRRREEAGCKSCTELRQEVSYLQAELDESRVLARTGSLCEKCRNLKSEIQHLMEQHEKDLAAFEKLEGQELLWKEQMEEAVKEKEKQFTEEKEKLEKELQVAQKNVKLVENQYGEKLRELQLMYEQRLQQKHEDVQEDLIKQRYSEEMEQLKSLCERGLAAMDASHKKIISELESRHQKELEDLLTEREKALAEEAHATAIALEAVRKAHSEELQRQVQKFKDEFVLKMNKRFETEAFKKCYESDLSSVKYEILSMTEKYSVKCLENATLQEKLEVMSQQLKSTTSQVVELLAKNQQLQTHLTSGSLQKQEELL